MLHPQHSVLRQDAINMEGRMISMKKLMAFALVLVMLLSCAAMAESAPSKTSADEEYVVYYYTLSAIEGEINLIVELVERDEMKQQVIDEIENFGKKLSEGSKAVECFAPEIQEKIAEKIPETDDLEINEIAPLFAANYDEAYGDVDVVIKFITEYAPEQELVAAIGTYADEESEAEWYILDAEALEDGTVKVLFIAECLEAVQAADAATIVILNTEA